uniref:Thioredoxin-like_fold domain-containing protein n=1 Tax=Heterorhabditis bacteriophora TaxID=37862 RepID=A0A1I7X2X1_HETBA
MAQRGYPIRLVDQELKQDETENYDLFLSTAPIGTFFRNGTERILRLYCLREELRELFGFKVVPLPDPTNIEEFQAWQNDTNLSNSTTNQYFDYIDSENESMIYKDGHFSKLFIVSIVGFITTLSIFTGIFLFFYCNVKSVFKREEVFEDIETRGEEDSEHQSIVKVWKQLMLCGCVF